MKTLTTTIARILFGIPFLAFGVMHLALGQNMAGIIPAFLPGGVLWVYLTGISLVAAALSLFTQKMTKEAMIGLSVFLISAVALIHLPGMSNSDPMMQQMAMSGLLKDIGLLGGALTFLGHHSK